MKFEYEGYVLEIIEECRPSCYSTKCDEPNLKLFNVLRANITLENLINHFKEEVDSLTNQGEQPMKVVTAEDISRIFTELEEKYEKDKAITHLMTQLDRLAQKDKENNFTPFELRGQLIEIYHLFGKILGLTLEDIHKYYFERVEK